MLVRRGVADGAGVFVGKSVAVGAIVADGTRVSGIVWVAHPANKSIRIKSKALRQNVLYIALFSHSQYKFMVWSPRQFDRQQHI